MHIVRELPLSKKEVSRIMATEAVFVSIRSPMRTLLKNFLERKEYLFRNGPRFLSHRRPSVMTAQT